MARESVSKIYCKICDMIFPFTHKIAKSMAEIDLKPFCAEIVDEDQQFIIASNHSNMHDVPVILSLFNKHFFVLAGNEPRGDINGIAFSANGVVWVKRGNKASALLAKKRVESLLSYGESLLIFPEATWNLTKAEPMLPLHWGVIDFSRYAKIPVVPVVLEYTKNNECFYSIGKPMHLYNIEDKIDATNMLRDAMSSMRWEIWEELNQTKRKSITEYDYFEYSKYRLDEYPKLDFDYEKTTILKLHDSYEEVFVHLNDIKPTKQNAFLFNKRLK